MPSDKAALPRRWLWWRRLENAALALVLLSWSLLLIAWLTLHWVILPHIDVWRPRIEALAGSAIGARLSIGEIQVRSSGWVPALELRDVRLFDRQGREALRLEHVQAALATHSLLSLQLRFEQLLVDGLMLELRRNAAGRLSVAGFEWDGAPAGPRGRGRDWLFEQAEVVVRNGSLRWTDEASDTEPLLLTRLDAVLRNGTRSHALRVDATPPAELGQRFSLRARFTQPLLADAGDLQRWSGTLFAELPQLDIGALRRHVPLPFEWAAGQGALRAWVDVADGVAHKATLDLALYDTTLRLAPQLQRLELAQVQGRLDTDRDAEGVRLATRGLIVRTGDGLSWPAGELRLAWRQQQDMSGLQPAQHPVTGGELSADRLDLEMIARTAERLPLGQPLRRLLTQLAPRGQVAGLRGQWQGPLEAPRSYRLSARVSALGLQAAAPADGAPARPGVRNATLQFNASERGGEAQVSIRSGALLLPGILEDPEVALDDFAARLAWRVTPVDGHAPSIEVELQHARLANADLQGEMRATWRTGPSEGHAHGGRFPGQLELSARLERGRAESVARYLPLRIAERARSYVGRAVLGGDIVGATFKVNGDLWDFPFHRSRDGELRIGATVRDLHFAYAPDRPASAGEAARISPWPAFEQVSGELEFDRLALRLHGLQGRLQGYAWHDVHGGIADLADPAAVLSLAGQGRGPADELLRFVRDTPLAGGHGAALQALAADGASELKLALDIPLAHPAQVKASGSLRLDNAELRLRADLPPLQSMRGAVDFTQDSFALREARASLLGGEARFDGGRADGSLRIDAQGTATAEGLRALPALAQAGAALRGQAAWRATLTQAGGRSDFSLTSDLAGMQIDLPAPLAKPAAAGWPMRWQWQAGAAEEAGDSLALELGEVLKLQYRRDLSVAPPRVQRGAVAVLDALPTPSPEVSASLKLGRIDIDAWRSALQGLGLWGEASGASGYLPRRIELRADELHAAGKTLTQVVASLRQSGRANPAQWQARVQSEQLVGDVDYQAPGDGDAGGRLRARLQRLSLPRAEVAQVEQLLAAPTASVPALDMVIDDFELRGHKLGRLEVQAVNRPLPDPAAPREWQLDKLILDAPEGRLDASGRWSAGAARRMAMDFKLDLSDSGAFIERLGGGAALRGGKGQVTGRLSWAGSPLSLDLPSLEGALDVAIGAGRFMSLDPGSARLIGVFGLQSLARRMSFDFHDLFDDGFSFDSIAGTLQVAHGVAETRDLRMHSLQAAVLVQGSADMQLETQDLRVRVVPNLDASGAALATLAISPVIGLGTLFAQWALREPLTAAATREFHITGSWADPKVQALDHSVDAPLPTPAAPASAAATTETKAGP